MDTNTIEPYRINNEYNVTEILAHFDSNYILHTLEDRLNNLNYTSSLIESNDVASFEENFKLMNEKFPGDSQNIKNVREEVYREIIRILTNKFNLEFNTVDDTIDIYTAAYYLYDFLVCRRNDLMIRFFTLFIINNKENICSILNIDGFKKNKDSSSAYGRRMYSDPKYAVISANIPFIIDHISSLNITLTNIFQSVYVNPSLVAFLDNAIADKGNFFRDFYYSVVKNPEIAPNIITNIRLSLQRLVGDISASHIDEIMAASPINK